MQKLQNHEVLKELPRLVTWCKVKISCYMESVKTNQMKQHLKRHVSLQQSFLLPTWIRLDSFVCRVSSFTGC